MASAVCGYAQPGLEFTTAAEVLARSVAAPAGTEGVGVVTEWSARRDYSSPCQGGANCTPGELALLSIPVDGSHPGFISGAAQVRGTDLKALASTYIQVPPSDAHGPERNSSQVTATWSDQWNFEPTPEHARGSTGTAWVSIEWNGYQSPRNVDDVLELEPATARLNLSSSYVDAAGTWHTDSTGDLSSDWDGDGGLSATMPLSFEYGRCAAVTFTLSMSAVSPADAHPRMVESDHYFGGASISKVLIPQGARFTSGALQAGLASYATVAVPEPGTGALMLAGLALVPWAARRARRPPGHAAY